jgi:hypothetical protein
MDIHRSVRAYRVLRMMVRFTFLLRPWFFLSRAGEGGACPFAKAHPAQLAPSLGSIPPLLSALATSDKNVVVSREGNDCVGPEKFGIFR